MNSLYYLHPQHEPSCFREREKKKKSGMSCIGFHLPVSCYAKLSLEMLGLGLTFSCKISMCLEPTRVACIAILGNIIWCAPPMSGKRRAFYGFYMDKQYPVW